MFSGGYTTSEGNTSSGHGALISATGDYNTVSGAQARENNIAGSHNTASGGFALDNNTAASDTTTGSGNTGTGDRVLFSNTAAATRS